MRKFFTKAGAIMMTASILAVSPVYAPVVSMAAVKEDGEIDYSKPASDIVTTMTREISGENVILHITVTNKGSVASELIGMMDLSENFDYSHAMILTSHEYRILEPGQSQSYTETYSYNDLFTTQIDTIELEACATIQDGEKDKDNNTATITLRKSDFPESVVKKYEDDDDITDISTGNGGTGQTTGNGGTGSTGNDLISPGPQDPAIGTKITYKKIVYQVTSPTSVKTVKNQNKKKATKVSLPSAVTVNGKSLAVTEIGKNAFKSNKKLKTVTIPASVTKIGENAFKGCKSLKKINVKTKKLNSTSIKNLAKSVKFRGTKLTVKVPKAKKKAYKKTFKKSAKKVKIK